MTFPSEFRIRIEEIRNDFTNGSTVIAGNALKLLEDAIKNINESDKDNILDLAKELVSVKPHMAAPTNIIKIFISEFPKLSTKIELYNIIEILNDKIKLASDTCISLAIEKLFKKEITSFLTCSYSSNVFNILTRAGNGVSVYILQSKWNGIDYSEIWMDKLSDMNVECYMWSEDDTMPNIDFALIGADAVSYSGDIINGLPSFFLAQSLKTYGIPLYVVAESFKKCKDIQMADGFELIPKEYITEIISDNNSVTF